MDPNSRKFPMLAAGYAHAQFEAMWHPSMGIFVTGEKMPMPGKKRVLQLWLIPKGREASRCLRDDLWPDADGKLDLLMADQPVRR